METARPPRRGRRAGTAAPAAVEAATETRPESLQRRIVLRYRSSGHLRFELPPELLRTDIADRLRASLFRCDGIFRVETYPKQRKLSIRYIDGVTSFAEVVRALQQTVLALEPEIARTPAPQAGKPMALRRATRAESGVVGWIRAKYEELKETVHAAGIVARNTLHRPANSAAKTEKFVLEFFTDILVLYLIKTHWHLITLHWLKRPWQYRYEWTASVYMIFLLVRSKKPKP